MPENTVFCLHSVGFVLENQSILYPKGVITKW